MIRYWLLDICIIFLLLFLSSFNVAVADMPTSEPAVGRKVRSNSSLLEKEYFDVRHSIEMTQPWFLDSTESLEPQFSSISPDGEYTLLLTMQGDLAAGKNHYTLWLYVTEELRKYAASNGKSVKPKGAAIYRLSTSDFSHQYGGGHSLPIRQLRWLGHGTQISFILTEEGESGDVYTFDIPSGRIRRLTNAEGQVIDYAISKEGNIIIYLANVIQDCPVAFPEPEKMGQYAFPIHTGMCEYSGLAQRFPKQRMQVFRISLSTASHESELPMVGVPISGLFTYVPHQPKLRISPDGKWATLIASPHERLPAHWEKYFPKIGGVDFWENVGGAREENNLLGEGFSMAPQFLLVNIEKGITEPIFDAPVAFRGVLTDSHWLPDSRTVILTHTHLPDDIFAGSKKVPPAEKIHFVEFDLYNKRLVPIYTFDDPITHRGFINESVMTTELLDKNRLIAKVNNTPILVGKELMGDNVLDYRLFERTTNGWIFRDLSAEDFEKNRRKYISVFVRQELNTPPDFYVEDPMSRRVARLTDLNPQLRELHMPEVQVFRWTAGDGKNWKGGLILPPSYDRSRRYPLVVQIHCFQENKFFRDASDPAETAPFAGRALASAGFVVLHLPVLPEDWDPGTDFDSPQGRGIFLEGLRSAIRSLSAQKFVDPESIGIIGWSAGGRLAMEAITKTDMNIKAVVIADAAAYGPLTYFLLAGWPVDLAKTIEISTGAYPWGSGKQKWIENNPVYQLDKVQAALRLETYDRSFSIIWYDVLTVMKRLNKPVEYYVYDGAGHALLNPVQRYISSQGSVDWMRFWLLGKEDPDPKKEGQYISWRKLKDQSVRSAGADQAATASAHYSSPEQRGRQ